MERYQTELRNKNRGYMKLIVWQKAMELFELVWKMTYVEAQIDFKLRAQVADAAQSISANIAEGYGRRSVKEYLQFLYVALGSAAETHDADDWTQSSPTDSPTHDSASSTFCTTKSKTVCCA